MKKKLDVTAFTSSLRGESVFFPTKKDTPASEAAEEPLEQQDTIITQENQKTKDPHVERMIPRYHDTMKPRSHDTTVQFIA